MDMDQAAVFLAGSILTCLGFIIVVMAILVINNLCSKYWKPIKWVRYEDTPHNNLPPRFMTEEELAARKESFKG
jgi:hypothetical protein